ncbi:hypothetical protein VMCG_06493 [Cytospora schulzeri]|uniref:FHA domain-containing protein n=1 Tax=Cytospora schulzeri TaxID=448051 RepID=A0A423WBP1_9PEZI|nr:hypothetical protein VMCG_06493 [Valsa malicola]
MSINAAHEDSVLVSLSTTAPDNITFPERRILLTESQPRVHIGRSSNRTTLGLLPTLGNGWIDSPVMSRHHAEIEADLHRQASTALDSVLQYVIKIRDAGSMHGTFLNKEKVGSDEAKPLAAGDEITFGMPVYRNQTVFKPATMTVGMEFRNARVFTVPDDCSTDENFDENEPIDDDVPIETSFTLGTPCTLGQHDTPREDEKDTSSGISCKEIHQIDGAIEIDSDSAPHDLISISSDDDVDDNDDESISLTDDEQMSSAPASPIDSVDLDDTIQMDDDGTRSPSWNRISTDSESEDMDEDSPAHRPNSDDEQGVFLYDSADSEELDEVDEADEGDPINTDFDAATQPSQFFPMPPSSGCAAPVLPSLSAAVFSQPQYPEMPFGYQLPPVGRSVVRQPSPSDAVLPLSHRHHGSEDDSAMAAENLGRKWGKPDFFEAREHNKITISRLTEPTTSSGASLVPDAAIEANNVIAENNSIHGEPKDLEDRVVPPATETVNPTGQEPAQGISVEAGSEQNASRPVEKQAPQGSQVSELVRNPWLLASGEDFLTSPLHEAPAMDLGTTNEAEAPDWTPASAYELHQYKQQNQARKEQDTETWRDQMDISVAENNSKGLSFLPKDSPKGKRKAVEISEATEQELAWHEKGDSMSPTAPSSPITRSEPDVSLPSPPTTPQERGHADGRPSKKIRKIAERVGYAALGGATVGAMVFTSLIYTAPSFA